MIVLYPPLSQMNRSWANPHDPDDEPVEFECFVDGDGGFSDSIPFYYSDGGDANSTFDCFLDGGNAGVGLGGLDGGFSDSNHLLL